tara:strand:- start:266 stop:451 length:186 start_codon:yes stop_codon:yes gene_type:complete
MNVEELIKRLELIKNKSLPVNIETQTWHEEDSNFWLSKVELSETGSSGYEQGGEVRLIGEE